jgi:hypothetical protein
MANQREARSPDRDLGYFNPSRTQEEQVQEGVEPVWDPYGSLFRDYRGNVAIYTHNYCVLSASNICI